MDWKNFTPKYTDGGNLYFILQLAEVSITFGPAFLEKSPNWLDIREFYDNHRTPIVNFDSTA